MCMSLFEYKNNKKIKKNIENVYVVYEQRGTMFLCDNMKRLN